MPSELCVGRDNELCVGSGGGLAAAAGAALAAKLPPPVFGGAVRGRSAAAAGEAGRMAAATKAPSCKNFTGLSMNISCAAKVAGWG